MNHSVCKAIWDGPVNQQIIVFEDPGFRNLLPLVYWRAVFELRCGRDSLLDKLRKVYPQAQISAWVRPELAELVTARLGLVVNSEIEPAGEDLLLINGRYLGGKALPEIPVGSYLKSKGQILAARISAQQFVQSIHSCLAHTDNLEVLAGQLEIVEAQDDYKLIDYPWDIVNENGKELLRQWQGQDAGILGTVWKGAELLDPAAIHIGPASVIKPGAVLDASNGPIYIDRAVMVSPNVTIQGPCFIGEGSLIQPSAVIHQDCSIGPVCKVGGEIEASILHSYSNKQHHGFLGHSYIGQWVNCGAGMTNSDLKNTYGTVKVPINGRDIDTDLTFVGMTMADHCKVGINAIFGAGSVVGFSCSIFTTNCLPSFVPSFSWITDSQNAKFDPDKGVEVAQRVMARRNVEMLPEEKRLFLALPEIARRFEKH